MPLGSTFTDIGGNIEARRTGDSLAYGQAENVTKRHRNGQG